MCLDRFGEEVKRDKKDVVQQPNRRQLRKGELRRNQRQLKRQYAEATEEERRGLQTLLDDINRQILTLSKAENQRKRRKKKRKTRQDFYKNPYQFAKKLFTEARSGTLDVPQEELQSHLHKTYSDPLKETPLGEIEGLPVLDEPTTPFNTGGVRSKEVADFVRKDRASSATCINMDCHTSSIRTVHMCFQISLVSFSELGEKDLFLRSGVGLTEFGFQRSRTQLALGASALYHFSMFTHLAGFG